MYKTPSSVTVFLTTYGRLGDLVPRVACARTSRAELNRILGERRMKHGIGGVLVDQCIQSRCYSRNLLFKIHLSNQGGIF